MNSKIPDQFIPLFIKNKDGPGYHRITAEEAQELKNDTSGKYYSGEGIDYNKIYDYVEKNKIKLDKYEGGAILGILSSIVPAAFNFAKDMIEEHTATGQMNKIRPSRGRSSVYSGTGFKHSDLYDAKKYALETNYNGFGITGCGGTFQNNNYKPSFPTIPFEWNW